MKKWVQSDDGSYTAYSCEYNEHYHSTKDGVLNESLKKHIQPAFALHSNKRHLTIIDICFGLGFNTLLSLYYRDTYFPNTTLEIYSPELDGDLVASLVDFPYPEILEPYHNIITDITTLGSYKDKHTQITVDITDARVAMRRLKGTWNVCYQDAFSPSSNPMLWTKEYFADIARLIGDDGIVTTYSTALATRLALAENGLKVYLNSGDGYRNATIATCRELSDYSVVDVAHKASCNPNIVSLRDENFDF